LVYFLLESHDEVVSITDDRNSTARMPTTPLVNPEIESVVQEDVGEERADGSLNAKGNFQFERTIVGFRGRNVVDLRRKR
jgi:hypothetical protein